MAGSSGGTGPLDNITKRISTLQLSNKQKSLKYKFKKINEEVVGSYIQSYEFNHEEGAPISHGSVTMESGNAFTTREATFYILARDESAENVAWRISDSTNKLTAASNAVAKVYLVAPCKNLNTWVICYEKFDALLSEHTIGMFPTFYDTDNEVSAYWGVQIREIIDALNRMGLKSVSHGSMSSPESYAFWVDEDGLPCAIKLIGVGKDNPKQYYDDLVDFVNLLHQYQHLNVRSNRSWWGFHCLVNSSVIRKEEEKYLWAGKVSGHPLLLDPVMKVKCYMEIHVKVDQMTTTDKFGASNALYCLCPEYLDNNNSLVDLIQCSPICLRIYNRKPKVYGHHTLYIDMILFVRNLIRHGQHEFQRVSQGLPWHKQLCDTVEMVFPGFMSYAYAVVESGRSTWSQWHYLAFNTGRQLPFKLSHGR